MTLKTEVLDKAMLRRTKEERKADMEIPSLEMQTVLLNLEEPEQVCSWETSSSSSSSLLLFVIYYYIVTSSIYAHIPHPYTDSWETSS